MSNYQHTFSVAIVPDHRRRLAVLLITMLALLAVTFSGLPWWFKWPLSGVVIVCAFRAGRQLQKPQHPQMLRRLPSGQWLLTSAATEDQPMTLGQAHLLSPWLVIMHGSVAGARLSLWFWRSDIDAEAFRRLSLYINENQSITDNN